MNANIYSDLLVGEVGAPIANANNTDSNSDILDMSGYEGVIFIAPVTDSAAGGVATLTAEANTANSDSGMAAITGAAATATCAINDDLNDKLLVVNVYRPQKRYIQAVRTSATANIAFGSLIAIRYGAKELPVTADSTILDSADVVGS
ncbi:MAG: hypothetical protein QUT30_01435 [Acidobacteriota bacterium]|nr:hypothetical protein [Acidobacteriota bacterium]